MGDRIEPDPFLTCQLESKHSRLGNAYVQAFEFFGGPPELIIPDNLKSAAVPHHLVKQEVEAHANDRTVVIYAQGFNPYRFLPIIMPIRSRFAWLTLYSFARQLHSARACFVWSIISSIRTLVILASCPSLVKCSTPGFLPSLITWYFARLAGQRKMSGHRRERVTIQRFHP